MAFNVIHSPSAAALGGVSRQAGQGAYSKFMQQLIEQKNARAQQERMQQRSLAQQQSQFESSQQFQQQRDKDYQQFQEDMKNLGFDLQQEGADAQLKRNIIGNVVGQEIKQGYQTEGFVKNAWQNYVGSVNNWSDWSPDQKKRFDGIQEILTEQLSGNTRTPQEKEQLIRSAISTVEGIRQTVVPRKVTAREQKLRQLEEQGRGIGDIYDFEGGKFTTDPETLMPKALVQPIKPSDKARTYKDYRDALTRMVKNKDGIDEEVRPSHSEIVKAMKASGIDWISDYEPGGELGGVQGSPTQELEAMVANPETRREVYYTLENIVQQTGLTQEQYDSLTDEQAINLIRAEEKMKRAKLLQAPRRY